MRATVLLAAAVCTPVTISAAEALQWQPLGSGLEIAMWTPGAQCDEDVGPVVVVKVDPERYRFGVRQYADEGLSAPLTIKEWQRRTGGTIVFNAGLFRDDYSYMGWLVKEGRLLGRKRHPQWQGLFVAEPKAPGLRKARVVDLAVEPMSPDALAYREAAQSLMLFDGHGKPRVRQSTKRAQQTVVAEDRAGNILLLKTTEAVGLWDLALCLRAELREIHQAMVMDGGGSSDLLIDERVVRSLGSTGGREAGYGVIDGSGLGHIPLPAVIVVVPR